MASDWSDPTRMNLSYRTAWLLARFIYRTYFRWQLWHLERVPLTGPVILAGNHASFLDPPLIGASLPRKVNVLARESLFRSAILGAVLRSWSVVPVDRDGGGGAGLKVIFNRLNHGEAIMLFIEGTRTMDGQLQPARSGIGLTVIKSAAPVVPLRIFGTFEAFGRHMRFPRPRRIGVKFGQPRQFAALRAEAQACGKPRVKAIYQEVADELMAAIAALKPGVDGAG